MIPSGQLSEIKSLAWKEVFSIWKESEAKLPRWVEHYRKRGFSSWDDWRKDTIKNLGAENLGWKLYRVNKPTETIPLFYAGPFRSWIKNYYRGKEIMSFSELGKNPQIEKSETVNQMINDFPKTATLIGLRTQKEIVIVDGLHRSCALAVANEKKVPITTDVFIVLADFLDRPIPIMGQAGSPAA